MKTAKATTYGPSEEYESKWRNTQTHSPEDMMSVYVELYFAGFPQGDSSRNMFLPASLARKVFEGYGEIVHFYYEERRGIGSVTFKDPDAAVQCFHVGNLYLVLTGAADGRGEDGTRNKEEAGQQQSSPPLVNYMLYLEFAQYLPFVNTLLLSSHLRRGLNRMLLRTFPRSRSYSHKTAMEKAHPAICVAFGLSEKDTTHLDLWWHYYQHFVTASKLPSQAPSIPKKRSKGTGKGKAAVDECSFYSELTSLLDSELRQKEKGSLGRETNPNDISKFHTATMHRLWNGNQNLRLAWNLLLFRVRLEQDLALKSFSTEFERKSGGCHVLDTAITAETQLTNEILAATEDREEALPFDWPLYVMAGNLLKRCSVGCIGAVSDDTPVDKGRKGGDGEDNPYDTSEIIDNAVGLLDRRALSSSRYILQQLCGPVHPDELKPPTLLQTMQNFWPALRPLVWLLIGLSALLFLVIKVLPAVLPETVTRPMMGSEFGEVEDYLRHTREEKLF